MEMGAATGNKATRNARRAAIMMAAVLGGLGSGSVASAVNLYWDSNGDTATTLGGSGNWLDPNLWRLGSTVGGLQSWTSGSDAKLTGATAQAGTLTIAGSVSANSVEYLNTGGVYAITGGTLNIGEGGFKITTPTGEQRVVSVVNSTAAGGHLNYIRGGAAGNTSRFALQGVNTFTGNINVTGTAITGPMTSTAARLDLNVQGALPSGADINFFTNNGNVSSFGPSSAAITIDASQIINFNAGGSGTTQEGSLGAGTGNTLTMNSAITGNVNLSFQTGTGGGAGLVVLNVANTYTGSTTLNTQNAITGGMGMVKLGLANALPVGTTLQIGINTGTFGSGALDLAGFDQTVAALRTGTNATSANTSAGITNTGSNLSTLTITGNQATTYGSTIGSSSVAGYNPSGPNVDNIALVLSNTHTGSLTLTKSGFYMGGTTVNGGGLIVNNNPVDGSGTGLGAVNVNAGGSVGGSGRIGGAVTLGTGNATFNPGGVAAVEDIQLDNGLTLSSLNQLNFDFAPTLNDKIVVSGDLALPSSGDIDFNLNNMGGLVTGTYDLISYTGSMTGNFATLSVGTAPGGATYMLLNTANVLQLQVSGAATNRTWTGAVNGAWDVNGTANWTGAGSKFINGDPVSFDDSGNNTSITIAAGGVAPSGVAFSNSAKNYSFAGGPISGSGGLTLTGSGTVTLNNANTFTGAVNVAGGGTLAISSGAAIGSASAVNLSNGSILQPNGAAVSTDRTISIDSTGGTINANAGNNLTATAHMTGLGVLTKTGPGTFTMAAASPLTTVRGGQTTINGGTVKVTSVNDNGVTGLGTGAITVNSGGTLDLGTRVGFQTNGTTPGTGLTVNLNDGGTVAGSTADGRLSGSLQIATAGTMTLRAPLVGDKLVIGNSVRFQGSVQSTAPVVNVTGAGIVQLASGATSTTASTAYSGSWTVNMAPTGVLSVGPILNGGFGETLNALGYLRPATGGGASVAYHGETRPVTVNSGTLAIGSDLGNYTSSLPATVNSFRSPVTLNGGNIASTGQRITGASPNQAANGDPVVAQIHGSVTMTANSGVLLYDPATGAASGPRNVDIMTDPNAIDPATSLPVPNDFSWGANQLGTGGHTVGAGSGRLRFMRNAGSVTVDPGASLNIAANTVVELAGTTDALSDGTDHVNVITTGNLEATAGTKNVGNITGAGGTIAKSGATLIANHVRGGTLTADSGTVQIRPTGGVAAGTSKTTALSIIASGKVDIGDNKLIVQGASIGNADINGVYSGLQGEVQRAYNGGAWDSPGLTTSMSDAATGLTTIGVATGEQIRGLGPTDTDIFAGQTINGASAIAMYTYAGDANLDGFISGDDYSTIDFNAGTSVDGYSNGDFNYDGIVSGDDYSTIDFNYAAQGAPFPTSGSAGLSGVTAVPEPASLGLFGLAAAGLLARRRRAK
jgi:autotransporter-associated beta strand protein